MENIATEMVRALDGIGKTAISGTVIVGGVGTAKAERDGRPSGVRNCCNTGKLNESEKSRKVFVINSPTW